MPRRKVVIRQVTKNNVLLTKTHRHDAKGVVVIGEFNRTFKKITADGKTYTRYHGSHWSGGNWVDENGDAFLIEQKNWSEGMNKDWKRRDTLLFGKPLNWRQGGSKTDYGNCKDSEDAYCALHGSIGGGTAEFHGVSSETFFTLMKEGFIDNATYGEIPSAKDFLDFIRKFPQVCIHGYAVDPDRIDYRVTVTGLVCKKDITPQLREAFQIFADAEEFVVQENKLWCVW